jgi:hypothetical protein
LHILPGDGIVVSIIIVRELTPMAMVGISGLG